MANGYVQVPPDSTGKKMQTFENTISAQVVESEAVVLTASAGTEIGTSGAPVRTDPTGTTVQPAALYQAAVAVGVANPLYVQGALTTSGTVTATLAAETTKVIGTVNQGTSPWVVSGAVTTSGTVAATLAAETNKVIGTVNQGTSPWVVSGAVTLTSTTITGSVAVTGTFFQTTQPVSIASLPSVAVTNAGTFVVQATLAAETTKVIGTVNQGTSPWVISGAVTLASTTVTGSVAVTGTFYQATQPVSGTVAFSNTTIAVTNTGTFVTQSTLAAETTKVIGTVNQGTSPWVVSGAVTLASTTITGSVAVTGTFYQTTQPVSIASLPSVAVTNAGTFAVQAALAPATTGGYASAVSQALTTSINVKASAGQLFGYAISNPNAYTIWLMYYNTATTPGTIGATTVLLFEVGIPAGSSANVEFANGLAFSSGIAVAVTQTSASSSSAPGGVTVTTLYK